MNTSYKFIRLNTLSDEDYAYYSTVCETTIGRTLDNVINEPFFGSGRCIVLNTIGVILVWDDFSARRANDK